MAWQEYARKLDVIAEGQVARLRKESHEFLTDDEKDEVRADIGGKLLSGEAYRTLFVNSSVCIATAGGVALQAYRYRVLMTARRASFGFRLLRGATLGYLTAFCLLTDSKAFY